MCTCVQGFVKYVIEYLVLVKISDYRKEIGCQDADWLHLAQDRDWVMESYEHDNEPSSCLNDREFFDWLRVC
jgi:hypothetical protein